MATGLLSFFGRAGQRQSHCGRVAAVSMSMSVALLALVATPDPKDRCKSDVACWEGVLADGSLGPLERQRAVHALVRLAPERA